MLNKYTSQITFNKNLEYINPQPLVPIKTESIGNITTLQKAIAPSIKSNQEMVRSTLQRFTSCF